MSMESEVTAGLQLLIGGSPRAGAEFFDVYNPTTGKVFCHAPAASAAQLEEAVEQAAKATRLWGRDEAARKRALAASAEVVNANSRRLATALSLEIGLPYKVAEMEVGAAAAYFSHRAKDSARVDSIVDDERQRVYVRRTSIGVTGAILPWNAPLLIAAEKIATAVAAGNTVIVKTSPLAPVTVLILGTLLADKFPPGVLSILAGPDGLGKALVSHPKVGMISFTGSIAAGQSIMAGSAVGLKRLSLELGGNDAAIVLPDIDVPKTARRLYMGAFFRNGQICAAIKRLYIHEAVFEPLVAALKALAESSVLGDPLDPNVTMGPVSNRTQFERVEKLVSGALAAGGSAVTGGAALNRPGNFFPPTLVTGLSNDVALVAEEQFGPALPILPFTEVEEAVGYANATDYGLGASVWTSNIDQGIEIASQLESGTAWVNQHGIVLPHIPFGGMKLSGVGRANGPIGLDSYSELQTISASLSPPKATRS